MTEVYTFSPLICHGVSVSGDVFSAYPGLLVFSPVATFFFPPKDMKGLFSQRSSTFAGDPGPQSCILCFPFFCPFFPDYTRPLPPSVGNFDGLPWSGRRLEITFPPPFFVPWGFLFSEEREVGVLFPPGWLGQLGNRFLSWGPGVFPPLFHHLFFPKDSGMKFLFFFSPGRGSI